MTTSVAPLTSLDSARFESPAILGRLVAASRQLAELKGVAASLPRPGILINALGLQEAQESSAIEGVVTAHEELYREATLAGEARGPRVKEVLRYREALHVGFEAVTRNGLLTVNDILRIQEALEHNTAGFRKLPGTAVRDGVGRTIHTPPQDYETIVRLMSDLERFINDDAAFAADPLVKMAIIHHQFESIHPFYDGNGRTGRIINVLYLVQQGLLDLPVLYHSRYIMRTRSEYYRLLQAVRVDGAWEAWVRYMLTAVEETARDGVRTIHAIRATMLDTKHAVRSRFRFYRQDLINHLFTHPFTSIQLLRQDLPVSRLTATKYLDALARGGILEKRRVGRSNFYVNVALNAILTGERADTYDRAIAAVRGASAPGHGRVFETRHPASSRLP